MSISSAKAGLEQVFAEVLQAVLGERAEFENVSFYASQRSGEKTAPCVLTSTLEIQNDGGPGYAIYNGRIAVMTITDIDEQTSDSIDPLHQDRVASVEDYLENVAAVTAAINALATNVRIYGYSIEGSAKTADATTRRMSDTVTLVVDFQTVST